MSDREQAIKDVAEETMSTPEKVEMSIMLHTIYTIEQRERVIALERALRGLDILLDFGDIIEPNTAQTFDDPTAINAAFAAARAALNDK